MRILLIVLSLVLSSSAQAGYDILKHKPLFEPPLANPRSASSGMSINTSKYKGIRIAYVEGIIGREIPIITWINHTFSFQIGLEATTWITLGVPTDGLTFPLLTQDFHFAFPVSFRYEGWSMSVKFNHISAHKGDGFDDIAKATLTLTEREEFENLERLGDQNGIDISLVGPFSYSRDYMSYHVGYDLYLNEIHIRPYFHIGYLHKVIPDDLGRWFFGNGADVIYEAGWLSPFFAQDVTWNEDTNSVDLSIRAGAFLFKDDANLADIGITFNAFVGEDRRGQLLSRKRMKEFGIGFFIR